MAMPAPPGYQQQQGGGGLDLQSLYEQMRAIVGDDTAKELIKSLVMQQAGGGGGDPLADTMKQLAIMKQLTGQSSPGYNANPLAGSAMMQSSIPSGGNVQWLGGMPPGYDDKVAQKLAKVANAGNLYGGLFGSSPIGDLGSLLKGGIGGLVNALRGGGR